MAVQPLLTSAQAAAHLGMAPATLKKWRGKGLGPRYLRLPTGMIRYAQADLDEWAGVARGRIPGTLSAVRR